ncbi:MAG: hypothetical protein L3K00_08810 [Thermoplasmata archaeon]|nr:hypothetical protein [Thermoplasmata archaeon]MCI4361882.1 hypothetical protein [Thermoplasmata archaeon]
MPANDADGAEGPAAPPARPLPPWLQPGNVRLVVSGLIVVYLVGILVDLRAFETVVVVEFAVLLVITALLLLTLRWWDPSGNPPNRPRARVFLALAGLALLVQVLGVVAESSDPNDLGNNVAGLLLLGILFLNTIG